VNGPYVHTQNHEAHLWDWVLVLDVWGTRFLAANHPEGIRFLEENQGSIREIHLMVFHPWTLDIRTDGSARLRYLRGNTNHTVEAPPGTFSFSHLLATITTSASDTGHYERNAMVFFPREGQSGGLTGRHLPDGAFVTSLFKLALERANARNSELGRLLMTDWPL